MSFCVLGPLEVSVDEQPVPIPVGKQRVLLASLLLEANHVVPVEELVERLWNDDLPSRPRSALHTYLARLRQTLARQGGGLAQLIRTSAAGYTIEVPPDRLDLTRFRGLLARAHHAAERDDLLRESTALGEALALWRGEVLPDVRSDSLHRDVVPKLTEDWLRALERYYEVCLALGRHDELVGELRVMTSRFPFHERLWKQLMLALYRCGRTVEALAAYAQVCRHMREELGVEPGAELRDSHVAILRSEVQPPTAVRGPRLR